jgi:hypothetical protein
MRKMKVLGISLVFLSPLFFFLSALSFGPASISVVGTDNCSGGWIADINWTHLCKIEIRKNSDVFLTKVNLMVYAGHPIYLRLYDNKFDPNISISNNSRPLTEKRGQLLNDSWSFYSKDFHRAPYYIYLGMDPSTSTNHTNDKNITVSTSGGINFYKPSSLSRWFYQPAFFSYYQWAVEEHSKAILILIGSMTTGCTFLIQGMKLIIHRKEKQEEKEDMTHDQLFVRRIE